MAKPEKLPTQPVSVSDMRRRAAVLRQFAIAFDNVARQMEEAGVETLQMKGTATYERAVEFLRGAATTANQAVLDHSLSVAESPVAPRVSTQDLEGPIRLALPEGITTKQVVRKAREEARKAPAVEETTPISQAEIETGEVVMDALLKKHLARQRRKENAKRPPNKTNEPK